MVVFWFHGFIFDGKLGSMVFSFHGLSELVPNHGSMVLFLVPWFWEGELCSIVFWFHSFWFHGLSELDPNHGTTVLR